MAFEKIITHSGSFHADDVFAVAVLSALNPEAEIIRTRDEKLMQGLSNSGESVIFVDVSGKFGDYGKVVHLDHHMTDKRLETVDRFQIFNKESFFKTIFDGLFQALMKNGKLFSKNDMNKVFQKIKDSIDFKTPETLGESFAGDADSVMWKNALVIIEDLNTSLNNGYVTEVNGASSISTNFDKGIFADIKNYVQKQFKYRKFSGLGLTWKKYGREYVKYVLNKEGREFNDKDLMTMTSFVDNKLVIFVDQNDNGIQSYEGNSFDMLDVIQAYNNSNPNSEEQYGNFLDATKFAGSFLKKIILREFDALKKGEAIFSKEYVRGNPVQFFSAYVPKVEKMLSSVKDEDTLFIAFDSGNDGKWKINSLRTSGFESKKDLPKKWLEKNKDGKNVTEGLVFVHQALFIAEFETLDFLKKAIENDGFV